MSIEARRRAERCFAVARSTTFEGERDNAVAMGTRIAKEAGLDLDSFDIPGRQRRASRPPPRSRFREDLFERERSPFWTGTFTEEDFADVLGRFYAHMSARSTNAGEEVRREREQRLRLKAERAAGWLKARGVRVLSIGGGGLHWRIPEESPLLFDDAGLIEVAEARGWRDS